MRILYFLRVLLISTEFLIIAVSWLLAVYALDAVGKFSLSMDFNPDLVKFLMIIPAGAVVWIANETRLLLQDDKDTTRLLVRWPDYWKLKAHTNVCMVYAVFFCVVSIIPWASKSGLSTGSGLIFFVCGFVGQLAVVYSIYSARIRLKEITALSEDANRSP